MYKHVNNRTGEILFMFYIKEKEDNDKKEKVRNNKDKGS